MTNKPLIQSYKVDAQSGTVTLTMPQINPAIADSVLHEVSELAKQSTSSFATANDKPDTLTITISNKDTTRLALDTTKLMNRRTTVHFEESNDIEIRYASPKNIAEILTTLKESVKSHPHAVQAIDRLVAVTQEIAQRDR